MGIETASILSFSPMVSWPLFIMAVLLAALVSGYGIFNNVRGSAVRALVLGIMLLALAGPHYQREIRKAQSDIAVIVVDRTASQSVGNRKAQSSQALKDIKDQLGKDPALELRIVEIGKGENGDHGSLLVSELSKAAADIPKNQYAGAIMITDGQVHDAGNALALETLPPGPVHVLLSGEKQSIDRRVIIEQAPGYGLVGKPVEIQFRIEEHHSGEPVNIAIAKQAKVTFSVDGTIQSSRSISPGVSETLKFEIRHAGKAIVEISVETLDGEISTLNNSSVVTINGIRDRLRVLLVSGVPHAGERTWRNLLKSDPAVDLVHFTILRPPEKSDFTPIRELSLITFPTLELFDIKIDEFDLMVFDRYIVRHVLSPRYFGNIAKYVRDGGALMVAAGPEYAGVRSLYESPVGEILPVRPTGNIIEQGFRPELTETGMRHPVSAGLKSTAWADQPWGRWFRQIETTVVGSGKVLMSGWSGAPLLILDHVDAGRVGVLTSDHIWLWARGFEGGGPQAELVRRTAHWLMKEPALEEERLGAVMEGLQMVITRNSLGVLPENATVTAPGGEKISISLKQQSPGIATGRYLSKSSGIYHVDDGELTTLIAVGARDPLEFQDLRAGPERLGSLVEQSGGAISWISDGLPSTRRVKQGRDLQGRGWIGLLDNNAYRVTGLSEVPLLPDWLAALLSVIAMCAAWWREGR